MLFSRNKCKLLPYIREDVYGLSPNDGQFYGWEINKFDIPDLWKKTKGEGVKVAVIDTGCDFEHHDLSENMLQGKNFVENGKPPMDRNGHGTHVAGTIAASDNNLGMVGVAPRANIIPIKALGDNGGGNLLNVCRGIEWAADNDADIITMSLGSPMGDARMARAIKYAHDKNILVFCAAGNSGPSTPIMYPAKYPESIAIGAIDINMNRTKFTCAGEELEFLSPGQDILSCVPGNKYAKMSGTSMSNPFAAGYAALVLSYYKKKFSKQECVDFFRKSVRDLSNIQYRTKNYQGYGILVPKI
jgi:subtilisin family serine protease